MTEELEKKLNELLGLKKLLEDATDEKQKTVTAPVLEQYKKKARYSLIRFCVGIGIGWALVMYGTIIYVCYTDVVYIDCPTIIVAGLLIMIVSKLGWLIRQTKLSILQEVKQFELRITEMLKK